MQMVTFFIVVVDKRLFDVGNEEVGLNKELTAPKVTRRNTKS